MVSKYNQMRPPNQLRFWKNTTLSTVWYNPHTIWWNTALRKILDYNLDIYNILDYNPHDMTWWIMALKNSTLSISNIIYMILYGETRPLKELRPWKNTRLYTVDFQYNWHMLVDGKVPSWKKLFPIFPSYDMVKYGL